MKKTLCLLDLLSHDVFRYGGGLNKSAAEVYWTLLHEPMPAMEIIIRTGRSRRTVFRALKRMTNIIDFRTGEIINMVEKDGSLWHAREVDLGYIAMLVGTAGIRRKQIEKHISQRRRFLRSNRFLKRHN